MRESCAKNGVAWSSRTHQRREWGQGMGLSLVHERCAGIDVHKAMLMVFVQLPREHYQRSFPTDTASLLALVDWLQELRVDDVAMESTGSYWKPVYNVLEGSGLRPIIGNATHMRGMPGRKTDVGDAEWICGLHRHGLVRPSYIPPRAQREMREAVRYRQTLVAERADEANRIQKVLEGANIKLGPGVVISDILGATGQAVLGALAAGIEDPAVLAGLARGSLKNKQEQLTLALRGSMGPHQRRLLGTQLDHVRYLDRQIQALSQQIGECLTAEQRTVLERLDAIPGISTQTAEVLLSEAGDMRAFPNARQFASWAGLVPGDNESGGKRRPARTRRGNRTLRRAMALSGQAAGRSTKTYLGAAFRRIAARRGPKRAALAIGRRILTITYHVVKEGSTYQELGPNYLDERQRQRATHRAVARLEALGYKVHIEQVTG